MTRPASRGSAKKAGLPPGTVVYVGKQKTEKTRIRSISYDDTHFEEKENKKIDETFDSANKEGVTWINVDGLQRVDVIEKIGKHFNLHPLTLEDIANTEQRPKMEDFGHYIYVVLRMLRYDQQGNEIISEQLSLILNSNLVLSFQESEGDVFDTVRERLRNEKGKIRKMGADYLLYALIDAVVDNYFAVLEKLGEKIEDIEDQVIANPEPATVQVVHNLKRQSIALRKYVWPLREVVNGLERCESGLISKATGIYLRDVYDHTIQVIDSVETFRDVLSGMLDIYLSSVSNRMNEVMKVLTIIATIFIPLTLVAGIYGMNFTYMPELSAQWGYPLVLLAMVLIAVVMLAYFKKRKWILQK
ncbi:MAG: magnesium/cobalt transporter CorA [Candidatus Bathyarchaeota archaeon]|nr:magnesium/cobalt transporter CorA [Candidatus Bathyarchaeota archaeon]